jgi:hypothetical protein
MISYDLFTSQTSLRVQFLTIPVFLNLFLACPMDSAPSKVPTPVIPRPLYECATIVRVRDVRAGAIVHIFNTQAGSTMDRIINANPQQVYYSSQADIRVYPALKAGDIVYAVQIGCNITSDKSNQISVQDGWVAKSCME